MGSKKTGKRKKSRTGLKIFIAVGLLGIVACCALILHDESLHKQVEIGRTDAELISENALNLGDVEVPKSAKTPARERKNASENYHVVSRVDGSGNSFDGFDQAIDTGTMYVEVSAAASDDGTVSIGGGSLKLSDLFDRYGDTVGYVIEVEDEGTAKSVGDLVTEYDLAKGVIVESYDSGVLDALEETLPDMSKMYLCRNPNDRSRGLGLASADIICMPREYMNEYGLNAVHGADKKFGIRYIETGMHISDAIRLGVDIYFTGNTQGALALEKEYRN